jgi:Carboxypeptidase regulatory-like domain/TonB dependent receptor-like, beta-barrel
MVRTIGVTLLIILSAIPARAQTERGGIRGTVTDTTQAVIPGVTVTATNVETGIFRSTETTGEGIYNLAALPGGTYRVEVIHPGMKTEIRENVRVTAASVTSLSFALEVGATQESVVVTADTLVQADTSTTGASLDTTAYADLPLTSGGSRRPNRFMLLVPGHGGNPTGFTDSIAGGQASTKEIQLEGASMATQEIHGDGRNVTFPPDAVDEVSVATAGYSAEYGNTGGGVERYVLKSGTNQWRGSVYEYLRNEAFDAAGFFDTVVPVHREHEWGGTFGGPLARNKSFFFFSFNRYTFKDAETTSILSMPTAAFRNGDFSAWSQQIYDPATTRPNPANPAQFIRDAFPGNIIPANRIDATAKKILEYLPLPNMQGNYSNYIAQVPKRTNERTTFAIKGDHQFNTRHRMSLSLVGTDDPGFTPHGLPHPAGGQQIRDFGYWFPRGTHDWVMSDNLVNQFRVGYNRQTQLQDQPSRYDEPGWPIQLGLRGMEMATAHFPRIAWSFTGTSTALGYNDRFATTYTASDGLLWTKGAHSFKFGGEIRRQETFKYLQNQANMNFARNQTALPTAISTTGLDFASFLLGYVDSAGLSIYGPYEPRQSTWQFGLYAQDDFKITQRLTINYGLRLDILTPLVEANDYYSMVDTTLPNPVAGNLPGVYVFAGQNGVGSRIAPADKNSSNLGPRLGVAYALNDKTVLRSAYGISYFQTGAYGGGNNVNQNDAYWPTSTTSSPDDLTGAYTFTQGFPSRDLVIPPLITPALGVGTGFVNYWHPTAARAGRSRNWSVGIQRALGRSMSIDVAYVGSRGDHLPVRVDINQLDPKYLSLGPLLTRNIRDPQVVAAGYTPPYAGFNGSLAQALRPFPQFPNMFPGGRNSDTRGTSTYDALQAKFDKRYSEGLYATVAYTWADHLTNAPNNFVNNAPMHRNAYDLSMSQHRPPTYRPHVGAVGFLYELPVGTDKRFLNNDSVLAKIIGGWQLSGILRYTSGTTLGVSATQANPVYRGGATAEGIGGSTAIPQTADIVAGVPMKLETDDFNPRTDRYLNSAAFAQPTGAFGSSMLTIDGLRGFASLNEDLALAKTIRMQRNSTIQIRVEMFNAFNRVEFGNPASNIGNPETFGRITSQANTPRNMQIALKVTF